MSTYGVAIGGVRGRAPAGALFSNGLGHLAAKAWDFAAGRDVARAEGAVADAIEPVRVDELRKRLDESPILERPELVKVRGVFYPAVLLTPGLWERPDADEDEGSSIDWRTPLQRWLFSGFEEWAPSWDITTSDGDANRPLFGQLGHGDVAFSLLVVVIGEGAAALRGDLVEPGDMVASAELTCWLVHRHHARAGVPKAMQRWEKTFDYCLLVDLEEGHTIERAGAAGRYSGYLWECVCPEHWLVGKHTPNVEDCFFVWEHTDFATPEAREYGLDALAHKRAYVEHREGSLALVQKSNPLLEGEPLLETRSFYALVEQGVR